MATSSASPRPVSPRSATPRCIGPRLGLLLLPLLAAAVAVAAEPIAIDAAGTVARDTADVRLAIPGLSAPAGFLLPARLVAVARPAGGAKAGDVPQGDDILAGAPLALPAAVDLPLAPAPAPRLGLWLCARGSAGQPGDELGRVQVRYADGAVAEIPIREGERASGQLKDPFPTLAERATSGLTGGVTVTTYVTWWDNPRPQAPVAGLRLAATHPRYLLVLLGASRASVGEGAAVRGGEARITVDSAPLRTLDARLAAVACPQFFKARTPAELAAYDADLADLAPALISLYTPRAPADGRPFDAADLTPEERAAGARLARLAGTRVMLRQVAAWYRPGKGQAKVSGIPADEALWPRTAAWYADCIAWLRREQGWPVDAVEIYNEQILSHAKDDRQRSYRFFNLVAERLRAALPGVEVGGTAECYPDAGLIGEFLAACGPRTDFVSWHLYPTGSTDTPFAELLRRADRIPRIAEDLAPRIAAAAGRPLPQYITEYHINYSAWKPEDRRLARGATPVWAAAVLIHALRRGEPQAALLWHFRDGGTYGLYAAKEQRPGAPFFRLLNQRLRGAALLAVESGRDDLLAAAVAGPQGRLLLAVNTGDAPVEVVVAGLPAGTGEQWSIGPDDQAFAVAAAPVPEAGGGRRLAVPAHGLALLVLAP